MKILEKENIRKIYSDALYWAMSPLSKQKSYHLSRVNESVLRKLIHYDKKNTKIDFSNEWIAKHTFLDSTQIEKSIPYLTKKGFIKCIHYSITGKDGTLVKRRIINIDWKYIEEILSDVPKLGKIENSEKQDESNSITELPSVSDVDILDTTSTSLNKQSIVQDTEKIGFELDDIIDIEALMINLGYNMDEVSNMISYFDKPQVSFEKIVLRFNYLYRQQQHFGYNNIKISDEIKEKLKDLIIRKPIQYPQ